MRLPSSRASEPITDRRFTTVAAEKDENKNSHKLYYLAQQKKNDDSEKKRLNTLRRLQINLHTQQKMPTDIKEKNVSAALNEIERDNDDDQVPL